MDNLSIDEKGNIYAASFPRSYIFASSMKDPFNINPLSGMVKISRAGKGHQEIRRRADARNWDDGEYIIKVMVVFCLL